MPQPNPIAGYSRDPLTGFPDRSACHALLEKECAHSAGSQRPFGLILFDIDRFKVINYSFGVEHGVALLLSLAELSRKLLRDTDIISRWGSQEFLCLLPNTDKHTTEELAEQLRGAMEAMVVHSSDAVLRVTASFSTACYPEDGDHSDRLLATLGAALHQAKTSGRNRVVPASTLQPQLFDIGRMLNQALHDGRVMPAFQPIVELKSGEIVAEEALARVMSPNGKSIPASAFIDAARELQLNHQIDRRIFLQTVAHCAAMLQQDQARVHFVNISGNLLLHPAIVADLLAEATRHCENVHNRISPLSLIVIEVTERELVTGLRDIHNILKPFLDFGIRLALKDFGSGYSSFKFLADLPFSFLKIEGGLIRRVAEPRVRKIVQGIQRAAADLGLISLAEYVENQQIADIVSEIGIDWGQGHLFGKPVLSKTNDTPNSGPSSENTLI